MEESIISLETRFAFLEETVNEMSKVVYDQQKQIDRMTLTILTLEEKLKDLSPSNIMDSKDETPPPHY